MAMALLSVHPAMHLPSAARLPTSAAIESGHEKLNQLQSHSYQPEVVSSGLTHLWTTPIMRREIGLAREQLELLEGAVLRRFRAFSASCDPSSIFEEGETVNDRFFDLQRGSSGQPSLLEELEDDVAASSQEVEAVRALRAALRSASYEYVRKAAGATVAEAMFAAERGVTLSVWASVHEGDSQHVPHDHENSAVSGVVYVATPPNSGCIRFEDPRVARLFWSETPFSAEPLEIAPTAGEVLLFPPWLVHSVGSSEGASAPRVSISFNLATHRTGSEDLTALANSHYHLD